MTHLQVNCILFCKSCGIELGFIRPNVNVAHFLYCEECDKAKKILPDHAFLQNWDEDIFLEPFADFTLEGSDGGTVKAHKAVLAGKSKVFKAMLRAGMPESVSGKVKIGDMTAGELRPLIDFLYSGSVNQRRLECHGVALYRASVKYDLPLLTAMCERFLEIDVSRDIRGVFELAVDYEVEKLQEAVLPFIFSLGFVESNRPALAMKILRAASKFECFLAYRKKNKKIVSLLMEIVFYRVADFCDNLQKEVEELQKGAEDANEVVLTMAMSTSTSSFDRCFSPTPMRLKTTFGGGHQTCTSNPPKVVASALPLSTTLNKPLKHATSPNLPITPVARHDSFDVGGVKVHKEVCGRFESIFSA